MVMMTCGENEENAENKCDDYHGDELGLEYEVDEEVEFAEIQLHGGQKTKDLFATS